MSALQISEDNIPSNRRGKLAGLVTIIYEVCALAGAFIGRQHYSPTPAALNRTLVIADWRYGGAVLGAVAGAGLALLLTHFLHKLRFPLIGSGLLAAAAASALVYLLCEVNLLMGIATLALVGLPWLIALSTARVSGSARGSNSSRSEQLSPPFRAS